MIMRRLGEMALISEYLAPLASSPALLASKTMRRC
jgi:hypothetical protein